MSPPAEQQGGGSLPWVAQVATQPRCPTGVAGSPLCTAAETPAVGVWLYSQTTSTGGALLWLFLSSAWSTTVCFGMCPCQDCRHTVHG